MSRDAGLDRLVNACLCPGFAGAAPPDWLRRAIDEGLGGVALYGSNVVACDGRLETIDLRSQRADLLVGIDEEGGDVTRLGYRTGSAVPGNLALGVVDDVDLTRRVGSAIGGALAAVGVNLDFAPVVDVNTDPENPVIGVRAFGTDAALVARHGRAFVEGVQARGVAACAKHFPGHGATRVDSHAALPVVEEPELEPFAAAIDAGVKAVMTAHVVVSSLDSLPATLSAQVLALLRRELGFDGVVVTDALEMRAVAGRWGVVGAAVRALAAGADLILLGDHDGERECEAIRDAVARGEVPRARVEEAAERVRALGAWASAPRRGAEDLHAVGLEAARRALRVRGPLPLAAPPFVVELRDETNLAVGDAHWSLADALAERGFLAGRAEVRDAGAPVPDGVAPLVAACRDAYRSAWQREWLARLPPGATLVALGLPDDAVLARGSFVAAHGAGRANTLAVAERLSGAR